MHTHVWPRIDPCFDANLGAPFNIFCAYDERQFDHD